MVGSGIHSVTVPRCGAALSGALTPAPVATPPAPPGDVVTLGERPSVAAATKPAATSAAASPRTWLDEVFYFAMTDRFENGDRTNDAGTDPSNPERFHGGDWQGVINRLDDLKDLGVTALWLSPIVMQDRGFFNRDGYHGYWPHDFEKTEPSFGTPEKLQELIDQAHARGIKVVVDVVLNHTGYNHPWANDKQHEEWFHHNESGEVKGSLWGLPDLAQENPPVADYLTNNALEWAHKMGFDGFRIDALKHMPREFTRAFGEKMHADLGKDFFLLGESYVGDQKSLADIKRDTGMDSVYDFPLSNTIRSVVGQNEDRGFIGRYREYAHLVRGFPGEAWRVRTSGGATPKWFHDLFEKDSTYVDPRELVTIIENHDMPRFMSEAGPRARDKYKQAMALQFCFRGIPCLYYGAEDGMGAQMPDLRADKRSGADPEMHAYVRSLAMLRHGSEALRRGEQHEVLCDRQCYAFTRTTPNETVLVAANVDGQAQEREIPLPGAAPHGYRVEDLLTGEGTLVAGDRVKLQLEAAGTRILRVTPNP